MVSKTMEELVPFAREEALSFNLMIFMAVLKGFMTMAQWESN